MSKKKKKIEKITEEEKIHHGRKPDGSLFVSFTGLDGMVYVIDEIQSFHMVSIDNTYRVIVSIEEIPECPTCGRKKRWWQRS